MANNMKTIQKLLLLLSIIASSASAQGTAVPESVRLMIEQSQAATQFEQMARMQIEVQYREFLDALSGSAQHKAEVEETLVAVLSERARLSDQVTNGQAQASQLAEVSEYDYLRGKLAPLLSRAELVLLDNRQNGPSDTQLKKDYADELTRVAVALTEADRELVLDTLVKNLRSDTADAADLGRSSLDELVFVQMLSFNNTKMELQSKFSGEKLQDVNNFMNQLQSNLYRNRSMLEGQ